MFQDKMIGYPDTESMETPSNRHTKQSSSSHQIDSNEDT